LNIADRQKSTWNITADRLASSYGIDPKVALLRARSGTLGEASSGPNKEPGQTANRIAEFGSAKVAVERASDYDALTTTTRMVKDKRRRDWIAVEGLLRPTQP
jgi:hypothetical protein